MIWKRLEPTTVGDDLDESLAARLADPAWMLARQWQIGELDGEDAADPLIVRAIVETVPLTHAGPRGHALPIEGRPLAALVEGEPVRTGIASWRLAVHEGLHLLRLLDASGLRALRAPLRELFAITLPVSVATDEPAWAALEIMSRRAVDAARVAAWLHRDPALEPLFTAAELASEQQPKARALLAAWRADREATFVEPPAGVTGWKPRRMRYDVELRGEAGAKLVARDHAGGALQWHDFDLERAPASAATTRKLTVLATPGQFRGMPESRWWTIEDPSMRLHDLAGGPDEVAASLVTAFTTIHSDDWLVVPVRARTNCLVRITQLVVEDVLGERHVIPHVSAIDAQPRVWKMFEHTASSRQASAETPWLLVLGDSAAERSHPIEQVLFVRDESANIAWAIERRVESAAGGATPRADLAVERATETTTPWHLALRSDIGEGWIPFLPRELRTAEIELVRGRLATWRTRTDGARAAVLQPAAPLAIDQWAIPPEGVQIERRMLRARGSDGRQRLWSGRSVSPGTRVRGAGLRFDHLDGPVRR